MHTLFNSIDPKGAVNVPLCPKKGILPFLEVALSIRESANHRGRASLVVVLGVFDVVEGYSEFR